MDSLSNAILAGISTHALNQWLFSPMFALPWAMQNKFHLISFIHRNAFITGKSESRGMNLAKTTCVSGDAVHQSVQLLLARVVQVPLWEAAHPTSPATAPFASP